jgi:hypothetical protein
MQHETRYVIFHNIWNPEILLQLVDKFQFELQLDNNKGTLHENPYAIMRASRAWFLVKIYDTKNVRRKVINKNEKHSTYSTLLLLLVFWFPPKRQIICVFCHHDSDCVLLLLLMQETDYVKQMQAKSRGYNSKRAWIVTVCAHFSVVVKLPCQKNTWNNTTPSMADPRHFHARSC